MDDTVHEHADNDIVEGKATRSKRRKSSQPKYIEASDSDDFSEEDPEFKPKKGRRNSKATKQKTKPPSEFATFCKEHRPKLKVEFPEFTSSQINDCLQSLWKEMSPATRATFSSDGKKEIRNTDTTVYTAFCCGWGSCDYQFEIVDECADHIKEHLQPLCQPDTDMLIAPTVCRWYGCLRRNRSSLPFILFSRLYRHIDEEHVLVARTLQGHELSPNFVRQQTDA